MYPEIQKKGQAAVDAAVGSDRLPDYNDEGKIPYVDALVMEVLRWRVMLPLGMHPELLENESSFFLTSR